MHCPSLRIPGRAAGWLTLWGKPKQRSYFLGYEWPKSSILYIAKRSHPGALFATGAGRGANKCPSWSVDLTHCSFPSQFSVDHKCLTDIFNHFCLSIKPLAVVVKWVERGEIYAQVPSPGPLHIVSKQCVSCEGSSIIMSARVSHVCIPQSFTIYKSNCQVRCGKVIAFLLPMSAFPCFEWWFGYLVLKKKKNYNMSLASECVASQQAGQWSVRQLVDMFFLYRLF